MSLVGTSVESRARQSKGASDDAIYAMVGSLLRLRPRGGLLFDIGCGRGLLHSYVSELVDRYVGADVVRYEGFPQETEFHQIDLDSGRVPLADDAADIVVAVETIEHLENPRAFVRELTRLCRPGGMLIVTTPNQLSFLSKLTLVLKNRFNAFSDSNYPAHITALLEVDLRRILAECGWQKVRVEFSRHGRIPGTRRHWPTFLSRLLPRAFSDNVMVVGVKPEQLVV